MRPEVVGEPAPISCTGIVLDNMGMCRRFILQRGNSSLRPGGNYNINTTQRNDQGIKKKIFRSFDCDFIRLISGKTSNFYK